MKNENYFKCAKMMNDFTWFVEKGKIPIVQFIFKLTQKSIEKKIERRKRDTKNIAKMYLSYVMRAGK